MSEVTKVYDFRGGPLDGQQRAVSSKYHSTLPPPYYEHQVREPLTLAASLEEYKATDPVACRAPLRHRYYYAIEYDCYKYLGAS